jgi:hypothetical protein
MADLRTKHPITEDQWKKIIDGGTSAKVWRQLNGPTYFSMIFDSNADTPTGTPDTMQRMFQGGDTDEFEYPSAAYVWVMCQGENGAVIVTE